MSVKTRRWPNIEEGGKTNAPPGGERRCVNLLFRVEGRYDAFFSFALASVAGYPAFLRAAKTASILTFFSSIVILATFGMATSLTVTPSTAESADRTFFTQPTPHRIFVTSRSMTLALASSAVMADPASAAGAAITPRGRESIAAATRIVVFIVFCLFLGGVFLPYARWRAEQGLYSLKIVLPEESSHREGRAPCSGGEGRIAGGW